MKRYYCASNSARKRGAIGVFHFVERIVEAEDIFAAEEAFRSEFECHGTHVVLDSGQMTSSLDEETAKLLGGSLARQRGGRVSND